MKVPFLIFLMLGIAGGAMNSGRGALVFPTGPGDGPQIISRNIDPILRHDPKFLSGLQTTDLTVAPAHRVYSVGLTNLAAGQLLSAATPSSWRYLLVHGTNAVGEANLSQDEAGRLKFNGFSSTRFADETRVALQIAENSGRLQNTDYEVRYLLLPSIHFVALWLHATTDDLIVPLPPTFARIRDYRLCSETEALQFLKPEAQRVLRQEQAEDKRPLHDADLAMILHSFDRSSDMGSGRTDGDRTDAGHHAGVSLGFGVHF